MKLVVVLCVVAGNKLFGNQELLYGVSQPCKRQLGAMRLISSLEALVSFNGAKVDKDQS